MKDPQRLKKLLKLLYVTCQQSLTEKTNEQVMVSKDKYQKLLTLREDLKMRIEFLRDQRSNLRIEEIKFDMFTVIQEMFNFGCIDKTYVAKLAESIEAEKDISSLKAKLKKLNQIYITRKQIKQV